jgi:hypothetical protein
MSDWNIPIGREFTQEEMDRVEKLFPHCPKCGEKAVKMHFYLHEVRKMWFEMDGSDHMREIDRCLINVDDEAEDRWIEHPHGVDDYPRLECENYHEWVDSTISRPKRDGSYWKVRESE